ncbi:hypothetical protein ABPG74_019639 [Tetrahymena malaccensis]
MILYSKETTKLKKKCLSCENQTHEIGECPYLHLKVNKGKIYGQMLYSIPHLHRDKSKTERSKKFKQSTLENLENNNERLIQYYYDRFEDISQYQEEYLYLQQHPATTQNSYYVFPAYSQLMESFSQNQKDSAMKESILNINVCNNIPFNINIIQQSHELQSINQSVNNNNFNSIHLNSQGSHSLYNNNSSQNSQNGQQFIQQISSNLKPISSQKKIVSINNAISFQKLNQSLNDEDMQENNEESSENVKLNSKIFQDTTAAQIQQQQVFDQKCIYQSSKLIDSCPSNLTINKQIQSKQIAKEQSGMNVASFKNDILQSQQAVINNNNMNMQHENKYPPSYKNIQSAMQISSQHDKKLTISDMQKFEGSNEYYDSFIGQFEKMKRMMNYFPYFNYENILFRLNDKNPRQSYSRKESIKTEVNRNFVNKNINKNKKSLTSQRNKSLSQSQKNYQKQRMEQRINQLKLKGEIINLDSTDNYKQFSNYVCKNKYQEFEEKNELNLEDFITQEEAYNLTISKIDPNTPTHSFSNELDFKNYKKVQAFKKRISYDFQ